MPRSSTGTYSPPPGTLAVPETTIASSPYNDSINDVANALTDSLSRTGKGGMQTALPMGGNQIIDLAAPVASSDAATKGYVDGIATGVGTRLFVRLATTANITISTALVPGQTIDGETLVDQDLVLVKNQSSESQNGIYIAQTVPARAGDFDTYAEFLGSIVAVEEGTVNEGTVWMCMCNPGGTIDVSPITYTPLGTSVSLPIATSDGGTGQITAGAGFDALKQAATTGYAGVSEYATAAEYRAGTASDRSLVVSETWASAQLAVLTDASTIAVDLSAGFNFGGAANAPLALGGSRELGAPSNVKSGQSGTFWFSASGSTRQLTPNSAWLRFDGVPSGAWSITTSQILMVSYVTRGTTPYITSVLWRTA